MSSTVGGGGGVSLLWVVLEVCRLVLKINQVDLLRTCSCSTVDGVGGLSSLWVVLEVCNAEVGCWYWNSFLYREWLQVDTSVIARSCC